jgi:putative PIN family toxin of toxin-antitoxin system
MTPPRLVFDTKVLLSALMFRTGALAWLRTLWQSEGIRPLVSRETAAELIRVLAYPKFRLAGVEREDLLADYLPWCETVIVSPPPAVPICRDPSELPFLQLALFAHADAMIAGDFGLFVLAETFRVPILTPSSMREWLRLPE